MCRLEGVSELLYECQKPIDVFVSVGCAQEEVGVEAPVEDSRVQQEFAEPSKDVLPALWIVGGFDVPGLYGCDVYRRQ